MKLKLTLAMAVAALAAVAFAPAAEAKTIKLFVKPIIGAQDGCRAAADQIKWSYNFHAKITRKNSPLPKNVIMRYSVLDLDTGVTVVKQKITLKPKKFFKVGALTTYTAGHQLSITIDSSFKVPANGRTIRGHDVLSDSAPTTEAMDAANPPLPACA